MKRVEAVNHAEGRYYNTNVDASNTISWRREYNIKDHLGNTRLVFTDRNRDELIEKNLHANEAPNYPGGPLVWSWLQSIDYSYNAQGWLTGINNWNPSATINTPALCTPAMAQPGLTCAQHLQ